MEKKLYARKNRNYFTAVPGMSVEDSRHVISLVFDCDEGDDFRQPADYQNIAVRHVNERNGLFSTVTSRPRISDGVSFS
jgi:hypothetical protein